MNEEEAKKGALSFLTDRLVVEPCSVVSDVLYDVNPEEDFIFTFHFEGDWSVGSSQYVTVSKTTGKVRYHGPCGE